MASFNVPCPSCESSVLIKSDAMIGKKVECPKCKYRFKVEEPSSGDASEKPKKKDSKKGKKAKGGSGMLVGGALGVLAILLLCVAGYFLFLNGDKGSSTAKTTSTGGPLPAPPAGPPGTSTNTGSGAGATGSPDGPTPPADGGGEGAKTPADGGGQAQVQPVKPQNSSGAKDVTNLLPGDTKAVYRVNMDRLAQTPLFGAFFDRNTLDFFRNSMTFEVSDIETYIHCVVGPERYNFDVFRLKKTLDLADLLRKYDQTKGPQGEIKGHYYGEFKSNAFVQSLGRALSTEALFGEAGVPVTAEDKKRWGENKPYAYCLLDSHTLIIAEETTLESFLNDLTPSGYPPYRTELTSPDAPPPDTGSPDGPGNPDGPGGPGGPGGPPPGVGGRPGGPGGGGARGIGLVLPPSTGIALAGQGRGGQRGGGGGGGVQPPSAPVAPGGPQQGGGVSPPSAPVGPGGPGTGSPDGAAPGAPGRQRRPNFTSIPTYRTVNESIKAMLNRLEEDDRNPPIAVYAEELDRQLLDQRSLQAASIASQGTVMGAVTGLLQHANVVGAAINSFARDRFKGHTSFSYNTADDARNSVQEHVTPLLVTFQPLIEYYLGTRIQVRNGNQAINGVPPPGGGGIAPGGGGGGDDAVGSSGPGGRPGGPPAGRGGPPGGPGGTGSPDGGPGGFAPGGGGGPGNAQSVIDIAISDKAVNVQYDLLWNQEKYTKNVYALIQGVANQLKGRMAVLSGETTWHDLAAAIPKIVTAKKPFPRGTAERDARPERFGQPYPPEQRASFFVDLLPFLGKSGLRNKVQEKKYAWYDKENLPAAQEWVPEFLVAYYPQTSWRAFNPMAENVVLGATNYVGLAGLGLDAGRYDPTNPEHAKKVGMVGYEWGSRVEDVTDGLSNTIYLIQVRPGLQRPWIAGGGATVMAVDDKTANPLEDFAHTTPDNKRGTTVLMGDGSVRWVNDTIDPAVFKAMVTRAGGEKITDLDKSAPLVPGKKRETELKGAGGQAPLPGSAGGDARPGENKIDADELQKFQGSWKVTFAHVEGKVMPADVLEKEAPEFTFDAEMVKIKSRGREEDPGRILLLNPKAKPGQIDFEGGKKGSDKEMIKAVYEIVHKDKIKMRFAKDGGPRPTEVRIPDPGQTKDAYFEIERIKN
jgi:uncharacterized protein (TIGR03067 family)